MTAPDKEGSTLTTQEYPDDYFHLSLRPLERGNKDESNIYSEPVYDPNTWEELGHDLHIAALFDCPVCGGNHPISGNMGVDVYYKAIASCFPQSNLYDSRNELSLQFDASNAQDVVDSYNLWARADGSWTADENQENLYYKDVRVNMFVTGATKEPAYLFLRAPVNNGLGGGYKINFDFFEKSDTPVFDANATYEFESKDIGKPDYTVAAVGSYTRKDTGVVGAYKLSDTLYYYRYSSNHNGLEDGKVVYSSKHDRNAFNVTSSDESIIDVTLSSDDKLYLTPLALTPAGSPVTISFDDVFGNNVSTQVTVKDSTPELASAMTPKEPEITLKVGDIIDLNAASVEGLPDWLEPYYAFSSGDDDVLSVTDAGSSDCGEAVAKANAVGTTTIQLGLVSDHKGFVDTSDPNGMPAPSHSTSTITVHVEAILYEATSSPSSDLQGSVNYETHEPISPAKPVTLVVRGLQVAQDAKKSIENHLAGVLDCDRMAYRLFDIHLEQDGVEYEPVNKGQEMTVRVKVPAELKGMEDLGVYHLDVYNAMHPVESTQAGDYLTFKTTHFSDYVIASQKAKEDGTDTKPDPGTTQGSGDDIDTGDDLDEGEKPDDGKTPDEDLEDAETPDDDEKLEQKPASTPGTGENPTRTLDSHRLLPKRGLPLRLRLIPLPTTWMHQMTRTSPRNPRKRGTARCTSRSWHACSSPPLPSCAGLRASRAHIP